ncbi:hypothetical protein DXG01_011437 [Tephrocybe rancida]|nr:hypothetical protein DXG01_011437 [Tephrocybe rancida]
MTALRTARFPMSMLCESLLAPRRSMPAPSERSLPQPVFLLQAPSSHGFDDPGPAPVKDMTGQGQVMFLLDEACRREAFTSDYLEVGNRARGKVVPLFEDEAGWGGEQVPTPVEGEAPKPMKASWANPSFSFSSFFSLKSHATSTLPEGAAYISTDDAISALIFVFVLRARLPRPSRPPFPYPGNHNDVYPSSRHPSIHLPPAHHTKGSHRA